jgi:hypothetical protein
LRNQQVEIFRYLEHAFDFEGRSVIGDPANHAINRRSAEVRDDLAGEIGSTARREFVVRHGSVLREDRRS